MSCLYLLMNILPKSLLSLLLSLLLCLSLEAQESKAILHTFDLEDELSEWFPTQPDRWKTTDGALHLLGVSKGYQPPHRSPHSITLLKDKVYGDFTLTAKVKTLQNSRGHRDMCIFWGWQDPSNFYYVHLGEKPDPNSSQIFIVKEAPRTPITKANAGGIPWKDDTWHDVKLVRKVESGEIEVYFDDMEKPAKAAVDTTYEWGMIGLGSFDDLGMWDDVRIDGILIKGKKPVLPQQASGVSKTTEPKKNASKQWTLPDGVKAVKADQEQDGNESAKAFDGKSTTRWAAQGKGRWIEVELAKPQELKEIGLAFHHATRNYRFDIATSPDGKKWTTTEGLQSKGQSGTKPYPIQEAMGVRFVRITSHGSDANSWINLTEVSIPGVTKSPAEFVVEEWANGSDLINGVAITVDDQGRVYTTNVKRRKKSSLDLRMNRDWVKTDLSFQTVEDRRKFYRESLKDRHNLPDRNQDGDVNWKDLTVETDRIIRVSDSDQNGSGDRIEVIDEFNSEVSGIVAGLTVIGDDLFAAAEPEFIRYSDADGDDLPERKQVIADGLQVHIGQGGHNLSGVTVGPDGRIYFSLADKGHSLTTKEGIKFHMPNTGAIFRCELDGSKLDRFSIGQRNAQELAFDAHGNLFSMDNDGDYPGEMERALYIMKGSDHGWRLNWQWLGLQDFVRISCTEPYNPWMAEKLFLPNHETHAAYLTPTIGNFGPGPCGFTANPGTALSEELADKFFLTNQKNEIRVFSFTPSGASFSFTEHDSIPGGTNNTGLAWAPDGSLFTASYNDRDGRVFRFDVAKSRQHPERQTTACILPKDTSSENIDTLAQWLEHADQRVRKKAQFEIVRRGKLAELAEAGLKSENPLAKLHTIWGIGQASRIDAEAVSHLSEFWKSDDPEVIAQCCVVTGESGSDVFSKELIKALGHSSIRVRSLAAIALGDTEEPRAANALLKQMASTEANDPFFRHALTEGIKGALSPAELAALHSHDNRNTRLAAIVALRRLAAPEVSAFLDDKDELVLLEAARAIHDDHSIPAAMHDLSALLSRSDLKNEAILRRAISAALRSGKPADLERLTDYVQSGHADETMQRLALASILWWSAPPVLDPVEGRYRKIDPRGSEPANAAVVRLRETILNEETLTDVLLSGIVERREAEWLAGVGDKFNSWPSALQSKYLLALGKTDSAELKSIVEKSLDSESPRVRETARSLATQSGVPVIDLLLAEVEDRSSAGRGKAITDLAKLDDQRAQNRIDGLIRTYRNGKLSPKVKLEVWEVAKAKGIDLPATPDRFLHGGDPKKGQNITIHHSVAQCIRCHQIGKKKAAAVAIGPDLTKIGATRSRDHLVASIIDPNGDITAGFGNVSITTKTGEVISGVLDSQVKDVWKVTLPDGKKQTVKVAEIENHQLISTMPPMALILKEREIRDIVAYLATLK